jgi:tRNA A37 N6-isopentenylltransferase MiaA
MEKAKHYAVSLAKKNDQLKSAETKLQEYQNMSFELVDEVSDAQKTAKVAVRLAKKVEDSSQRRLDMVKELKGEYKDVIEELEQQAEVFDGMLEEKDYFIQELTLE